MHNTEFISLIETYAPLKAAAPWDNSGVQVESDKDAVHKVCVALDPTPATVSAALELKADFLLCHHPLALSPRHLNARDQYFHVVRKLIHADCRLYSAHTSLDANPRGPVSWLSKALGLTGCELLEPMPDMPPDSPADHPAGSDAFRAPSGYGFGLVGDLPQAMPFKNFTLMLEKILLPQGPVSNWRLCGQADKKIKRVAYCPGSGASLAGNASALGADIYITGDIKYHDALSAPLCILDVGHFCLEERMMLDFSKILEASCPNLKFYFLPADNPFRQLAI